MLETGIATNHKEVILDSAACRILFNGGKNWNSDIIRGGKPIRYSLIIMVTEILRGGKHLLRGGANDPLPPPPPPLNAPLLEVNHLLELSDCFNERDGFVATETRSDSQLVLRHSGESLALTVQEIVSLSLCHPRRDEGL